MLTLALQISNNEQYTESQNSLINTHASGDKFPVSRIGFCILTIFMMKIGSLEVLVN